jgi:bacterioferritin-associated ferredoxin
MQLTMVRICGENANRSHSSMDSAMYVCICHGVTDQDIRNAADAGCGSLTELTMRTGLGSGCGTCGEFAREILAEARGAKAFPLAVFAAAA